MKAFKNILISALTIALSATAQATVVTHFTDTATSNSAAIGQTGSANAKSVLELVSTTKSFLPPRMTTTQRDAISSPPEGSFIENTTTNTLDWYTGTAWRQVASLTNITTASTSSNASFYPLFVASSSNSVQTFNLGTGLTFNPSTNALTTTTFSGALSGTATNATNGTTVATSSNASFYPLFAASSSNGNQPFNLDTSFTYNPSTDALTATTFAGNATTATTATNATNEAITDDTTTNATMYPAWFTAATGNLPAKVSSTKMTFNPSTATLTTTTFSGALSGNATTATTATNATNTAITDDTTTNATMYPTWVTTASSNQAQKVSSTKMTFNPSTGLLVSTGHQISGQTASTVPYLDASKNLTSSAVTPTELGYVSGVTSAIQTQINSITGGGSTSQSASLSNVSIAPSISSNTMVLALKQADGTSDCTAGSPCTIAFRSSTASTGGYTLTSFTAATSLTLGTADSIGFDASISEHFYVYAISDSTSEVCASVKLFDEGVVQSATAMTGGAEVTTTTLYCPSAHTSKPIRLLAQVWATWSNPNWGSLAKVQPVPFRIMDTQGDDGNRSAVAGMVGEFIQSQQTSLSSFGASTGQVETCVSISLTAGDWDISGVLDFQSQAAASVTEVLMCAGGTTTGNSSAGCTFGTNYLAQDFTTGIGTGLGSGLSIPSFRVSPTSTTTYHLKQGFSFITTAPKTRCRLSARRIR